MRYRGRTGRRHQAGHNGAASNQPFLLLVLTFKDELLGWRLLTTNDTDGDDEDGAGFFEIDVTCCRFQTQGREAIR